MYACPESQPTVAVWRATPCPQLQFVKKALRRHARAVIAARNEPSGDPTLTHRETHFARALRDALSLVDIRLIDYLIVGESITSMAERGLI